MIGLNIRAQLSKKRPEWIVGVRLLQVLEQFNRSHRRRVMIAQINLEVFAAFVRRHMRNESRFPFREDVNRCARLREAFSAVALLM
jgi:hypothetical protein